MSEKEQKPEVEKKISPKVEDDDKLTPGRRGDLTSDGGVSHLYTSEYVAKTEREKRKKEASKQVESDDELTPGRKGNVV